MTDSLAEQARQEYDAALMELAVEICDRLGIDTARFDRDDSDPTTDMLAAIKERVSDRSSGAARIVAERQRQIDEEGYDAAHDDAHGAGELAEAAESYVSAAIAVSRGEDAKTVWQRETAYRWPWEPEYMQVSDDPVRNLEKAGALIAAEIDRLQRLEANAS